MAAIGSPYRLSTEHALERASPEPGRREVAAEHSEVVLSVVSPVYLAAALVERLVDELLTHLPAITKDFEVVLVEDGSLDASWEQIVAAALRDPRVRGIKLSRNFGQHQAISAGLDHCRGRWVVVMDCDLQDDPADISRLWQKASEGYDVVFGIRRRRSFGVFRNAAARLFFLAFNWLAGTRPADPRIGSFSIISRRVVTAYRRIGDVHRHYLMVLRWLGFRSTNVEVRHRPRPVGRSSYHPLKLIRHGLDGITSQSDRLLHVALGTGFLFLMGSIAGAAIVIARYYLHGLREGWASTIVVMLLSTSVILFAIGTVGLYVGRIFDQVRQRPMYVVDQMMNFDEVSGAGPRR